MIRLVHLVIGVILVVAAFDKALHVEDFRRFLALQVPLIDRWSPVSIIGALALIGIESTFGLLLLLGVHTRFAVVGSIALLTIFTIAIVIVLGTAGDGFRCGCGGVLTLLGEWSERGPVVIGRNVLLIVGLSASFIPGWVPPVAHEERD